MLCRNQHVAAMLGLSLLEWEAVQSCVQSRGSLFIQYGEATGTGVSGLFWQGLQHAGCDSQWDWISLCCGCFRGSLPPSTHILTTHPFLPQCVEELEDPIACYLRNLCRSSLICRPILLDFSLDRKPSKVLQPGEQTLLTFVIMGVGRKLEAVSPLWGRRAAFSAHRTRPLEDFHGVSMDAKNTERVY